MQLYSQTYIEIFQGVTWTWTNPETKRNHDFTLFEKELNWFDAKAFCAARGAKLVQPNSELKDLSIREKFKSISQTRDVWLGATQHPNGDPNETPGDQYLYTDGTTVGFTNFRPGKLE